MNKTNPSKFKVEHFSDYHDITGFDAKHKALEIGCYPVKGNSLGYSRYFGLIYKGRKPSFKKVWVELEKQIDFGECRHYRTGRIIIAEKSVVCEDLKRALRRSSDNFHI